MSRLDDFDALERLKQPTGSPYAPPQPLGTPKAPHGWDPGVKWDGKAQTITSRPSGDPVPDWSTLLKSWGFDPDAYEVLNDTVRVATWEVSAKDDNHQIITKQLWSHRAHIRLKSQDRADVDSLIAEIRKRRPRKRLV